MSTRPEKRQSNLNSYFTSIKESQNHIILELERNAEITQFHPPVFVDEERCTETLSDSPDICIKERQKRGREEKDGGRERENASKASWLLYLQIASKVLEELEGVPLEASTVLLRLQTMGDVPRFWRRASNGQILKNEESKFQKILKKISSMLISNKISTTSMLHSGY